jgi:hypothetical protein
MTREASLKILTFVELGSSRVSFSKIARKSKFKQVLYISNVTSSILWWTEMLLDEEDRPCSRRVELLV